MADNIVPSITVGAPYYDDYNEDKLFLRMLFRPGFSVQGRELTQLQTILQKQVDRFGSHIFKNGSIVSGAESFFDTKVTYAQIDDTYNGSNIDPTVFLNQKVVQTTDSTVTGTVVAVQSKASNGSEPAILVIQLTGSNLFLPGRTLQAVGTSNFANIKLIATGSASVSVGNSSIARINEGVFFVNGFFCKNLAQTIILEPYSSLANFKVGFEILETIVTSSSDTSLLDPALESANRQAPGADRLKIELRLSKRDLDSTDDTKFIELMRIENGYLVSQVRYPDYAQLEDTFARRTYDESGDYTVRAFRLVLKEDQGTFISGRSRVILNSNIMTGTNTYYSMEVAPNDSITIDNHSYTVSSVTNNNSIVLSSVAVQNANNFITKIAKDSRYTVQLDPGKAYVKGYEFETISPTKISSNKARDTTAVANYEISLNYGNYFIANSANGLINTTLNPIIDLHNANSQIVTTGGGYTSTKVGTARVMSMDSTGTGDYYRIHLYDIRFSANASFANVKSISSDSNKTATANVSIFSKDVNGFSYLSDTNFRSFVYRFPQSAIAPGTITAPAYTKKYAFTAQNFNNAANTSTSGTLSLPTGTNYFGTGTLDSFTTTADFIVVVRDRMSSNLTTGQVLTYSTNSMRVSVSTPTTATISVAANSAFVGDIIATVEAATTTPKTKTRVTANTSVLSNTGGFTVGTTRVFPNTGQVSLGSSTIANSNVWFSLYLADAIDANVKIYHNVTTAADLTDTTKDITSRFQIDNGQRDALYDYAEIKLKYGQTAPSGNVVAVLDYYTHQGTGYFTVDSYPGANTSAGYSIIPNYTSSVDGSTFNLRNCIDFRPRRIDANTATTSSDLTTTPAYTLQNADLPASETNFLIDSYQYYLSRIDKIVLSRDKIFKILKGIPSLKPVPPADETDSMTLYSLVLPAYTFNASDIIVNYVENKRYTMRDIGNLEKRIQSLEYYNALNLLEKNANDLLITDDQGNPRSKYGVLVDSFTGYQVTDVGSADVAVSLDTQQGKMYPATNGNNVKLVFDPANSDVVNKNGILMLPYTTEVMVVQDKATDYDPVAAYAFANWLGTTTLYPASDYWYDSTQAPDVVVNLNGQNDNWEQFGQLLDTLGSALPAAQNPFNTVWGSWETTWTGSTALSSTTFDQTTTGPNGTTIDTIQRTVTNNQTSQQRLGTKTVIQPQTITQSLGNKVIDTSIIPYIRAQKIYYSAINMRPTRSLEITFDDVDVSAYCARLNAISLANSVSTFVDGMPSGENITGPNGYSAKLVMSTGKVLYVTDETGTRPQTSNTLIGSNSSSSGTVLDYFHRTANVASANASSVTLSTDAPLSNTAYNENPFIFIVAGSGAGQRRHISNYNGLTKTIMIDRNWTTIPTTNSVYSIGFHVTTPTGQEAGIFYLPKTPISFHTGERTFRLADTIGSAGAIATSTTSSDVKFYAQGLLNTKQNDTISIRVPEVVRMSTTDTRTIDNITTVDKTINTTVYGPPGGPAGGNSNSVVTNSAEDDRIYTESHQGQQGENWDWYLAYYYIAADGTRVYTDEDGNPYPVFETPGQTGA